MNDAEDPIVYPENPPWTMFFDGPLYEKYKDFMMNKDFSQVCEKFPLTLNLLITNLLNKLTPKQSTLQYKSFENTVKKGEITRNEHFSFSHSVLHPFGELSAIFTKL